MKATSLETVQSSLATLQAAISDGTLSNTDIGKARTVLYDAVVEFRLCADAIERFCLGLDPSDVARPDNIEAQA